MFTYSETEIRQAHRRSRTVHWVEAWSHEIQLVQFVALYSIIYFLGPDWLIRLVFRLPDTQPSQNNNNNRPEVCWLNANIIWLGWMEGEGSKWAEVEVDEWQDTGRVRVQGSGCRSSCAREVRGLTGKALDCREMKAKGSFMAEEKRRRTATVMSREKGGGGGRMMRRRTAWLPAVTPPPPPPPLLFFFLLLVPVYCLLSLSLSFYLFAWQKSHTFYFFFYVAEMA